MLALASTFASQTAVAVPVGPAATCGKSLVDAILRQVVGCTPAACLGTHAGLDDVGVVEPPHCGGGAGRVERDVGVAGVEGGLGDDFWLRPAAACRSIGRMDLVRGAEGQPGDHRVARGVGGHAREAAVRVELGDSLATRPDAGGRRQTGGTDDREAVDVVVGGPHGGRHSRAVHRDIDLGGEAMVQGHRWRPGAARRTVRRLDGKGGAATHLAGPDGDGIAGGIGGDLVVAEEVAGAGDRLGSQPRRRGVSRWDQQPHDEPGGGDRGDAASGGPHHGCPFVWNE